jgi:predicted DNA-binding ribbon-helix-helix protein
MPIRKVRPYIFRAEGDEVKTRSFRLEDTYMNKIEKVAERRNLNKTAALRLMIKQYKG